ncbi:MAG: bifunctional nicotinamidase/pyrazinamidase [Saprospiraceae bacterium]|nr:bifunctional nicotinamidase/pyrazinamidase [Saprospiraceae bacterium]
MKKALIIIDLQNDFTRDGGLEVPEGNEIIPEVNRLQEEFDIIIATQDWHPPNHGSFASNHPGKKAFDVDELNGLEQVLWPDHCIQGSRGAEFHPELKTEKIQAIIRKGMDPGIDSYSGFFDNGHRKSTGLSGFLKGLEIENLFFCGLAADYCVYYSIKDALSEGFHCTLFLNGTRPISSDNFDKIKEELKEKGVQLIN